MAEEPKTPAVPPADQINGGGTPPKSVSDNPRDMIPRERLNEEINSRKTAEAELAKIKADKAKDAEEALKKNNEYKTLFEQSELKRDAESKKAREANVRAAFVSAASGKNIVNLDDAYVLAQDKLSTVQVADDGSVGGIAEIIDSLVKDKPYLLSKSSTPVGSPSNPAPAGGQAAGTRIYTTAEIKEMTQAEYEKNSVDINKAQVEGRIRD